MAISFKAIEEQFVELLFQGEQCIQKAQSTNSSLNVAEVAIMSSWVSKGSALINYICPKNSPYTTMFNKALSTTNFYSISRYHCTHIGILKGIIDSVKQDYDKGLLNVHNRITQEVFTDFLEMADYLIMQELKDPAAAIIGAVLEDALRKLAVKNSIPLEKDNGSAKTIEPLNQDLYRTDVYDKFTFKQVTSWAELRNNAAHGHYYCYDLAQVKIMKLFVEKFCADFLG